MLLTHKINIPIYNQEVWIFVGEPYEFQDYLKNIEKLNGAEFDPNYTGAICIHRDFCSWIWLSSDSGFDELIHELSHAVFDLMDDVGLHTSDQEAFCYLIQYLVKECQNLFAIRMDPIKQV